MSVDYLGTAKSNIARTNGDHPTEHVKAWALVSIAYVLIYIAENMRKVDA